MSNTLSDIAVFIPAKYRNLLYVTLALTGLVLVATAAGFVAVAVALPKWLIAAQAAYGVVAPVGFAVAKANVAPEGPPGPH